MSDYELKDANYINIQAFMVKNLHLKGNELLVYAIIYGYSQDGETHFTGSLKYLSAWTGASKQGVMKNLKSLVNKGYIKKVEIVKNGVKFCEYYATQFNWVVNSVNHGGELSCIGGGELSSPNTIDIDNKEDTKDNTMGQSPKAQKEPRHRYGEYQNVLLSDTDYGKLVDEFPNDYQERIERLSSYMASTGKHYKNHLATIRNWARRDGKQAYQKPTSQQPRPNDAIPDYDKDNIYKENGELDLEAMALNFWNK